MTSREPARTKPRRIRAAGLVVVIAAIVLALDHRWPASSSSTASSRPIARLPVPVLRTDAGRARGAAGGAVPKGATAFDDEIPAVANLDADLLGALRRAAVDAAGDGVAVIVDSGWRSPAYQERLLQEAIAEHGSAAEAARWVATPDTSAHVSGDAVDLGPAEALAWLSEHGAGYGLCQIYDNEPWHYELRPDAGARGCPARYADPTHDPRMQP